MSSDLERECAENLMGLVGKRIIDIDFSSYDDECWRIHIMTESEMIVMTFCREWKCPVVERRDRIEWKCPVVERRDRIK